MKPEIHKQFEKWKKKVKEEAIKKINVLFF